MIRERKGLWIEVRDSDTGERTVSIYAAPVPKKRAERELFLNRYVPMIFPGAKMRRYAGGTGTYHCGMLLINAHYGAVTDEAEMLPLEERHDPPEAKRAGQGELFAA